MRKKKKKIIMKMKKKIKKIKKDLIINVIYILFLNLLLNFYKIFKNKNNKIIFYFFLNLH